MKRTNTLVAVLGVLVGVALTLAFSGILKNKKFDGDYKRWRKILFFRRLTEIMWIQ